jgi:hypothetical protein
MDHHQRELRRAAAEAFNESLDQLAMCFQPEEAAPEQSNVNEHPDQMKPEALDATGEQPVQRKTQA